MNTCNLPPDTVQANHLPESPRRPQFRISEHVDGPTVSIALPGVRKGDLKLTLLEANLRIEATRHDVVPEAGITRPHSSDIERYHLNLKLGSRLDGTRTTASLKEGVLTLQVPIREESKPRQIEVN